MHFPEFEGCSPTGPRPRNPLPDDPVAYETSAAYLVKHGYQVPRQRSRRGRLACGPPKLVVW
jgi:hypothetical protein